MEVKLTKAEAIKVMQLDLGTNTKEDINHYTQPNMPALTFNGAKLCRRVRGCVSTYYLIDYTFNGFDLKKVLEAAKITK